MSEADAPTTWERFGKIEDLLAEAERFGKDPEVLLRDIQEQLDAIHERLAEL